MTTDHLHYMDFVTTPMMSAVQSQYIRQSAKTPINLTPLTAPIQRKSQSPPHPTQVVEESRNVQDTCCKEL